MAIEKIISMFMMDNGNSDNKELIIDYFLSWTLRCAANDSKIDNSLLKMYATRILSVLVYDDFNKIQLGTVAVVKTWKQSNKIDLWVEIEFTDGTKSALLIEDKAYSKLHGNQLERYRDIFEDYYKNKNVSLNYSYFTIREKLLEVDVPFCDKAGYKAFTMDMVYGKFTTGLDVQLTGNELFDEFWFTYWW
jgi:hypothetical protein